MPENEDELELCTVTIKNVPVQVRQLFKDLQLYDSFIDLKSLYGHETPQEIPAGLFTRLVIGHYLSTKGGQAENKLKRQYGIELIDNPEDLNIRNAYNFTAQKDKNSQKSSLKSQTKKPPSP